MSSRQHGFMKSRSTFIGMEKIIETILKHKQKELTSLIAIDIAGAFDNAWWPAIIKRMDNDNVPSDLIRIIKYYLNKEREVKFTYESETFYKKLTKGCPQGGPLSPLLRNILLNDLLINFESINADIICYADDVTIICWNKTIEGLKTASEYTLNYVIQWCNRNKLTISTEKTNLLYLHNREKISIKVNNNIIRPVKQVKILGMKFSNHKWKNKVNFTPHVNDILCKAGRMKNLLCSLSGNMWGLDTQKRLTLYKTIIRPVLTYGSEIWLKYLNNRSKQKLNSMQYQIILWAVRAYKTTSSNCVHSLEKIPLLTDYIESRIIKYDLAHLSTEDLITYEPHAQSIVKSFFHAKMKENFDNTSEIFRSFFVSGIPRFFRPNFYNIQFITDHGNFGKFLATIGAVKEPGCFCGDRPFALKNVGTIFRNLCLSCVEPILLYASGAWWRRNRDQKVATTLERVQRTAALRITGGYRTTSSEAFLVLAGLIPLGLKLEEETTRQKIWENREDALGLKAGALESKRDPRKPQQWLPKWNWRTGGPTGISTEVFTDSSKSGTNTGAGVVIFTNGELIFQESLTLRVDKLVFSAELVAISEALRVCAEKNFSPDRLYSDCMSALVAINLEKGQLAHQIIQELGMMTRAPELPWFRRHSPIEGNEFADRIAKAGCFRGRSLRTPVTKKEVYEVCSESIATFVFFQKLFIYS
ncbi:hypothetical protein LAZ67_1005027 [Cordylochernes scorpioides]|uniref:Reverse transcriptase domain-containing protein n=1 Tax=Cordylochernes scorpioides TaxID=51811 RepID=A0ABY6JZN2_9ARAC|nr:hypothetical protein LAZ67_1005027 [Cordylochernes scorpioides]